MNYLKYTQYIYLVAAVFFLPSGLSKFGIKTTTSIFFFSELPFFLFLCSFLEEDLPINLKIETKTTNLDASGN